MNSYERYLGVLNGQAVDDGLPGDLQATWSKLNGPGAVSFENKNELSTTANETGVWRQAEGMAPFLGQLVNKLQLQRAKRPPAPAAEVLETHAANLVPTEQAYDAVGPPLHYSLPPPPLPSVPA